MIGKLLWVAGGLVAILLITLILLTTVSERWVADRLESAGSEYLGANLEIGELSLDLISLHPSTSVSTVTLAQDGADTVLDVGKASASVDLKALFGGDLVFQTVTVKDTSVNLSVDENGRSSWQFLIPDKQSESVAQSDGPPSLPAVRTLELSDVRVQFSDAASGREADLNIAASGSTVDANTPTTVQVNGTINDQSASLDGTFTSLTALTTSEAAIDLDVVARVNQSSLSAKGQVAEPGRLRGIELALEINADGLNDIESLVGITLPSVPPFTLSGDLLRDGDDFVLRRFDGQFGDSDIAGDLRANPTTEPPTLYATVRSRQLDLDDLAGLVGSTPDPTESATEEQVEQATTQINDERLLPDRPIDLLPLTKLFNGALDYQADSVSSERWPVDAISLRAEINGDQLAIAPFSVTAADGTVKGSLNFDVRPQPTEGVIELEINRLNLRRVMKSTGIDDDSFGMIGGRLKYWVAGDTVHEMAASLDGGTFLLMTDGKLDALLVELAGIDLVESLTLLVSPGKTRTDIRCAYLDLLAADGRVDISRFVIDTEDTVFLADGTLDFKDESLDITLEPHPKDASILAAETAVHIEGTFMAPSILPGRSLAARAAAATLLATVAAPAAALLPFLDTGNAENSEYCSGLVSALADAK